MEQGVQRAIERLEQRATAADVPQRITANAAAATRQRFGSDPTCTTRRIEAYFWAVVRRASMRGSDASVARSRFVLEAVVRDLRAAGRDDAQIAEELERGWQSVTDPVVLSEFRQRLCA